MLTQVSVHHEMSGTVVDLGTWSIRLAMQDAMDQYLEDQYEEHGPYVRTFPGIGAGVTNVTFEDGHAIYFRETLVRDSRAHGPLDPAWHIGALPGWDSTYANGDQLRIWARTFNTYTPELGDSRAMVDLIREDTLAPEGIVPGVETIQLTANYREDQESGIIRLTAAEARRVAHDLLAAADVFEQARHLIRDEGSIRAAADYRADL